MQVHQLAKLLGVDDSRMLLIIASELGVNVGSASSLTDDAVTRIRSRWPTPPVNGVLSGRQSPVSLTPDGG